MVSQEPLLFATSIADNIRYGHGTATMDDIRNAAKAANALDFVDQFPDGFDTLVGERGVQLSGGQKQRIAIARALLKDPAILVLDEATSALDSEVEATIQKAFEQVMDGKTVLAIAHRLSTLSNMDRIIVLDRGKIVEQGSHPNLLKQNGIYSNFWKRQSGGFINFKDAAE